MTIHIENEFPVNAFPEKARNAIYELSNIYKAPVALIGSSIIGAISLASQNKVDVCRLNGIRGPVSISLLIEAVSGERKSTLDNAVMKPFYQLENECFEIYKKDFLTYNLEMEIYNSEKKRILASIRRDGKSVNAENELKELMLTMPVKPTRYRFIFNDATPAALKEYLCGEWRAIGLMSDESYGDFWCTEG